MTFSNAVNRFLREIYHIAPTVKIPSSIKSILEKNISIYSGQTVQIRFSPDIYIKEAQVSNSRMEKRRYL